VKRKSGSRREREGRRREDVYNEKRRPVKRELGVPEVLRTRSDGWGVQAKAGIEGRKRTGRVPHVLPTTE
jgi:hypothetical protein